MLQFVNKAAVAVVRSTSTNVPRLAATSVKMSSSAGGRFDLVVYGATGFTGQYVVEEVARVAEAERKKLGTKDATLRWAVAGRNKTKLLSALEEAKTITGLSLTDVGVLEANLDDQSSIDRMTAQAKVVINCVGPYIKYGEQVVKSCIENGADHVDISGEPMFLEGMQLKYDQVAEEKGVHIVGACGYDSVPAEMGIQYLMQQFPGGLNSVEMYGSVKMKQRAPINTGTLESFLIAVSSRSATVAQQKKLYPTKMAKPKYRQPSRSLIHYNPLVGRHGLPVPSDQPMVYRTQRYRHDVLQLQPVQFRQFLSCRSWLEAAGMALGMAYLVAMALFSVTRNLVMKYPEILTGGFFSSKGASREALLHTSFTSTLVGQGWSQPLAGVGDQHAGPPDTTKILKVHGPDPGYGATSLMMVASAMTLLRQKDDCERRGGVMTPGIAFAKTELIQRLLDRGMTFAVVD